MTFAIYPWHVSQLLAPLHVVLCMTSRYQPNSTEASSVILDEDTEQRISAESLQIICCSWLWNPLFMTHYGLGSGTGMAVLQAWLCGQ